ncbi:MAG: hypothetical protein ACHQK8_06745, partial [Bacteroidia bacterium]
NITVVKEICTKGNLQEYEDEVSNIVNNIENHGFGVAPRYDINKSSIAWDQKIIRPSLKEASKGIAIIWDLLHEYGHAIDGEPKEPSDEREIKAWDYAREMLSKYPKLHERIESFESRRVICLKTYGINEQNK